VIIFFGRSKHVIMGRGASGSDKTDENESLDQTKQKMYLTLSGSVQNRTNLNRPCLVRFSVFHFEIQETD